MKKGDLKRLVEQVLRDDPSTRNDDTLLALVVWHKLRPDLFMQVDGKEGLYIRAKDLLDHLPNHDHVSRIRRKFQEGGDYVPTLPEVARKRRQEIDVWKGFAHKGEFPE